MTRLTDERRIWRICHFYPKGDEDGAFERLTSHSAPAVVSEVSRRFVFCIFIFEGMDNLKVQIKETGEMLLGLLKFSSDAMVILLCWNDY